MDLKLYSQINNFKFMGLRFHNADMLRTLEVIDEFIDAIKPAMIFTPTAELIVRANSDLKLKNIYNNADLLTIDSYVVFYSAKLLGKSVTMPVSAARVMLDYLPAANKKKRRIYLLGAAEEVVKKTAEVIGRDYPQIVVTGYHDGYFDFNNDDAVVSDIINKSPDILFVALSSPLKENFISKNLHKMNVPVSIGVGGTFDIIAGKCKLAPRWISVLGLEWLYRFLQEPKRLFKRYLVTNSKYLLLFIKEIFARRA